MSESSEKSENRSESMVSARIPMTFGWFLCSGRWAALAVANFARINSTTMRELITKLFFHMKVMIKSNGLKYNLVQNYFVERLFSDNWSSGVAIPMDSDGFR